MRGNETEPKFKYKKIPRSPLLILDYANQFNAMNETTSTQKRINLKTLKDNWSKKMKIDFTKKEKVFSEKAVKQKAIEAKEEIKEMMDRDILQLKKKKWNDSVSLTNNKFLYRDYIYMNESIFDTLGFSQPTLTELKTKTRKAKSANPETIRHKTKKKNEIKQIKKEQNEKVPLVPHINKRMFQSIVALPLGYNMAHLLDSIKNRSLSYNKNLTTKISEDKTNKFISELYKKVQFDKHQLRPSLSLVNVRGIFNKTSNLELSSSSNKQKEKVSLPKANKTNSFSSIKRTIPTEINNSTITDKMLSDNIYSLQNHKNSFTFSEQKTNSYLIPVISITKTINKEKQKKRPQSSNQINKLPLAQSTFYEAYKKIYNNFSTLKRIKDKKIKEKYDIYYFHPGIYRQFSEEEPLQEKPKTYMAWSCCLKEEKDAKGCIKQYDKKMKWSFD